MMPPGMVPGGTPSGPPGQGRGQSPPAFPGLMPSSGKFDLPRGFTPPREPASPGDGGEEIDIDTSTANAFREWEAIRQAFEVFRGNLGSDFEPMGPEFAPPDITPFGPALIYRTYSIAGIWMNYYMGLIILQRAYPTMPPLAIMAAGMAAQQTGMWANEIARIAAGLHEDTTHVSAVSTLVGSAFIESGFPLFVAGVQVYFLFPCLLAPSPHLFTPSQPIMHSFNIVANVLLCSFKTSTSVTGSSDAFETSLV